MASRGMTRAAFFILGEFAPYRSARPLPAQSPHIAEPHGPGNSGPSDASNLPPPSPPNEARGCDTLRNAAPGRL
ncbi:hypothetical protein GCM10010388_01550 [Streptomyces mauvecolor]